MAEESKKDTLESVTSTDPEVKETKKKKGFFSRLWKTVFRTGGDDFQKRLEHISKEEAAILARVARRSQNWRRMARQLIMFSVLLEVIAVGYAIMTTRSLHMNWKMRALRVLPMFLLPALSIITYSGVGNYTRMRDRKDHKTLEKLRSERQSKIDGLKEKTNYYATLQLIQKYDTDPQAKAAAAAVLASKLGAEAGLKVHLGDEAHNLSGPSGKSNDVEVARTAGLRKRKPSHSKTSSTESASMPIPEEGMQGHTGFEDVSQQHPLAVEHYPQTGVNANDGGWIARIAALLVGEDPTQSYALICGNCHMHNGLARKEDFPFITYYCPHCNALNRSKQTGEQHIPGSSPLTSSPTVVDAVIQSAATSSTVSASNTPRGVVTETSESNTPRGVVTETSEG